MQSAIQYVLSFLLGYPHLTQYVGYTANMQDWKNYKVVVVPSSFFQNHANGTVTMPLLPLLQLDNLPILFGEPKVQKVGDTWVIYADLVASAFFLLSRYEETLVHERDTHGRFQAVSSLAYKAGFLHRPLVDEYGDYLKKYLQQAGVTLPTHPAQATVTLTHDVDVPFEHRTTRSFLGGIYRRQFKSAVKNAFSSLQNNSVYTFPWLLEQESKLPFATQLYFMRMPLMPCKQDKPYLNYQGKDMQCLINLLKSHNVKIGLHTSYYAGANPQTILAEKTMLEKALNQPMLYNRYHFLRTCQVTDMETLQQIGILHDYTLGFADCIGFRLATTRPVKYLSPYTLQVGSITLHPLMAMDSTLFAYMKLSYQQALEQLTSLMQYVKQYGGECVLLWHNTTLAHTNQTPRNLHKQFYQKILELLQITFGNFHQKS